MIAAKNRILVGLVSISVSLSAFSQAPSSLPRIAHAGGQIEIGIRALREVSKWRLAVLFHYRSFNS